MTTLKYIFYNRRNPEECLYFVAGMIAVAMIVWSIVELTHG